MATKINPKSVVSACPFNIHQLLQGNNYLIPDYQRDFVWKESQVEQLWKDLREHYKRNTKDDFLVISPDAYFLGAIVVLENNGLNTLEVIDGQQRLTTLTCMATVLFEKLKALTKRTPDIDGLQAQVDRMVGTYSGGAWKTNVSLSPDSINSFLVNSCIINRDKTAREGYWRAEATASAMLKVRNSPALRIRTSIEVSETQIEDFLSGLAAEEDRARRLTTLTQVFAECVVMLQISTTTHATAYDLFESLNFRGIPLTQADLVKNEIIKLAASASDRDDIIENWGETKSSLNTHDTLSLPEFLHYSFLSRYEHIKATRLFESVRAKVRAVGALKYSEELLVDAEALEKLVHGDTKLWTAETNCMLKDIREILNIKFAYIALLPAYRQLSNQKALFEEVVRVIMNFVFRFMKVLDGDVESLSRIMRRTADMINKGDSNAKIAVDLQKEAPDSQFIDKFKTVSFGNAKMSYFTVYYLEKEMLSGTLPIEHGKEQNLEHIMPKVPIKAHWPTALAEKQADPDKFRDYLWMIGNLIPLPESINKAIKNRGIAYKRANPSGSDYAACSLQSPKDIGKFLEANSGDWTYKSIEDRQAELANNYATKAWRL